MPVEIRDAPEGWTSADPEAIERARTDGGLRAAIARALWNRDYQPGAEAQVGGYVYEIADKVASALAEHGLAVVDRSLLEDLADPDPCWFDHHGGCQAHGYLSLEAGERCPHAVAKELLDADDAASEEQTGGGNG